MRVYDAPNLRVLADNHGLETLGLLESDGFGDQGGRMGGLGGEECGEGWGERV